MVAIKRILFNFLEVIFIMINVVQKFLKDEKGVGAIEYGLLASLIAVVIITSVTTLGTNLTGVFKNIAAKLSDSSKN
ncbi:hypothetical protein G293_01990 [Candidatus Liberibacter africanus PTSAPSY]|uniref:Flp/Fap pilin component n=2 Tax=Liberibacter africanus TaxID=34020 RepID=A0A0G3I479_LIBAF|nr:hypothetical protein G293_01990 [Candidatus Liberibacter africanus PTSAPSY]